MAWSYGSDPENSDKDAVRFLVGDTDSTDQLIQDEEITYLLNKEGAVELAASRAAEAIAAKFSRFASERVGRVQVSFKERSEQYLTLAKKLRDEYVEVAASPFVGGISIADKTSTELDADRTVPSFTRDLHDNPRNDQFVDDDTLEGHLP